MAVEMGRASLIFNRVIGWLARCGISAFGAQELVVRGRRSGLERTTPVNPITVSGASYLVAPRGETDWARNARVHADVVLRVGRRSTAYRVVEVTDEGTKVAVLRRYLAKWAWEVGRFFPELGRHPSENELLAAALHRPMF